MKDVVLNGSGGRIEAKYYHNSDHGAPIALVLHPHPLHGGTMNNKVVYNAFHAFVDQGFSVLRFNFRGVGRSEGAFDDGIGELGDAAIALDWIQNNNPESPICWVAGFSFGSFIMFQLLMRRPEINGFVALSPPSAKYDFNFLCPCPIPGAIIQGTEDEISKEDDVYKFYKKLDKQRGSSIDYYPIKGADHFFKDYLDDLRSLIADYIKLRISADQNVKKVKRDRRRKRQLKDVLSGS